MVREDQRQFDPALAGALANTHPTRRERHQGIGKPARPSIVRRARRCQHDGPREILLIVRGHITKLSKIDTKRVIEFRQPRQRAMYVDRLVVAGGAQQGHHSLGFAERINADKMRPVRVSGDGCQQFRDFTPVVRVTEDR